MEINAIWLVSAGKVNILYTTSFILSVFLCATLDVLVQVIYDCV